MENIKIENRMIRQSFPILKLSEPLIYVILLIFMISATINQTFFPRLAQSPDFCQVKK
jgi:hypothetical protein